MQSVILWTVPVAASTEGLIDQLDFITVMPSVWYCYADYTLCTYIKSFLVQFSPFFLLWIQQLWLWAFFSIVTCSVLLAVLYSCIGTYSEWKVIGKTSAAVGPGTAVPGPKAANVSLMTFLHTGYLVILPFECHQVGTSVHPSLYVLCTEEMGAGAITDQLQCSRHQYTA